jgi:hypothetical protein
MGYGNTEFISSYPMDGDKAVFLDNWDQTNDIVHENSAADLDHLRTRFLQLL